MKPTEYLHTSKTKIIYKAWPQTKKTPEKNNNNSPNTINPPRNLNPLNPIIIILLGLKDNHRNHFSDRVSLRNLILYLLIKRNRISINRGLRVCR